MPKKTIEDLAREERLEYYRNWRAKNKEKVKESNRKYWERKALEKQKESKEMN